MDAMARVLAFFTRKKKESVTQEEIEHALRTLYGTRASWRKRQRKRAHMTYKQRDEIAWLLLRMQREIGHAKMTKSEWIDYFFTYTRNLAHDTTDQTAMDAATKAADEQQAKTGSDDAAMWQAPGAAAQQAMNAWNAEQESQRRRTVRMQAADRDIQQSPDDAPGYSGVSGYHAALTDVQDAPTFAPGEQVGTSKGQREPGEPEQPTPDKDPAQQPLPVNTPENPPHEPQTSNADR